jgi:hypothetical protein
MQRNADGSVDLFFGSQPPDGKEANWIYTAAGKPWVVVFRFYGPEKALLEKTWQLPDLEKMELAGAVNMAIERETRLQPQHPTVTTDTVPVTADNFYRAETDMYFGHFISRGAFGKFYHFRDLPLEGTGVRPNRDTLYSQAVFDLDAGPVTITLPDAGSRFMSMIVIDEDHYVTEVVYGAGRYTYTREQVGTRYVFMAVRTLVNPTDLEDMKQVHALQDAFKVEQPGGPGRFEVPNWDPASQKKVRDALLVLNETLPDFRRAGGRKDQVDPVRHLIATASGWGLNPDEDAIYLNITPDSNDGTGIYKFSVRDVPVDGFWSISVYDAEGHFVRNELDAYTLNNITAKKDMDGSITIQFGGCDGKVANCLPIFPGWNYMVRFYRPRKEILDDTWKFPEAQPVR